MHEPLRLLGLGAVVTFVPVPLWIHIDTLNGISSLQHASASRAFRMATDASRPLNLGNRKASKGKERMKTCDKSHRCTELYLLGHPKSILASQFI